MINCFSVQLLIFGSDIPPVAKYNDRKGNKAISEPNYKHLIKYNLYFIPLNF